MATAATQAVAAGGLYVNSSTGSDAGNTSCLRTQPCKTITHALSVAAGGSTINVAAGTYPEQVVISPSLPSGGHVTIKGAGPTSTVIDPTATASSPLPVSGADTDSSYPQYADVQVEPGTNGFALENLEVNGSGAVPMITGCEQPGVLEGIYVHDASGSISHVDVSDVSLPENLFGCQPGAISIYVASDIGSSSDVTMTGIAVNTYTKGAVVCDDPGTTCSLTHSRLTGIGPTTLTAANAFQAWGAASATLSYDHITANTYTGGGSGNDADGILLLNDGTVTVTFNSIKSNDVNIYAADLPSYNLWGANAATPGIWTISDNSIHHATDGEGSGPGDGYGDGIQIDSTTNDVQVTGNYLGSNVEYGISLLGASGVTVSYNQSLGNDWDGIYVGGPGSALVTSTGNTISDNITNGEHNYGIFAGATSVDSGNTFSGNRALHNHNSQYQIYDGSSGPGSAGTANTWTGSTCSPNRASASFPSGIC